MNLIFIGILAWGFAVSLTLLTAVRVTSNHKKSLQSMENDMTAVKAFLGFGTGSVEVASVPEDGRSAEQIERDTQFDERIAELEKEISQNIGTPAEELHPLVQNLPHNIIKDKFSNPPVLEVAE